MSLIIAFWPDEETARRLSIPGGEKQDNLHMTLMYVSEEPTQDDIYCAVQAVNNFVREYVEEGDSAITGRVSGFGRFANDEEDVLYAGVDMPGLEHDRHELMEMFEDYCSEEMEETLEHPEHGFTPHITLKYMEPGDALPFDRYPSVPLTFEYIVVAADNFMYRVPLANPSDVIYDIRMEM